MSQFWNNMPTSIKWLLIVGIIIICIVGYYLLRQDQTMEWKITTPAIYPTVPSPQNIPQSPQPDVMQQGSPDPSTIWYPSPIPLPPVPPVHPNLDADCDIMSAYALAIIQHRRDDINTDSLVQRLKDDIPADEQVGVISVLYYALNVPTDTDDNDISYNAASICHRAIEIGDSNVPR